ncbi:hypothetical protein PFICI_08773 [Pestalotiopsis fici W106-1]|uniref:2EXR domain-containing protein n=1 Tax=Pestalotiopsis fici (strain W106-1 / CGMCC3.15140) TaxID=1229662 RepID=W3WYJ7_PESFW|nr:uncharacterized protein PFICI_08773 [Pestalotiopsis fici W106-1]ETS78920.1 hypothetical protein PFICI_08773 [Pestalotiopsis fici W106-1]
MEIRHQNCPIFVPKKKIKKNVGHERESQVSFPFMKLPAELRDTIWHFAAQRGRLVGAKFCKSKGLFGLGTMHRSWNTPPAIAHVCYHSRFVALRYGGMIRTLHGEPVPFYDPGTSSPRPDPYSGTSLWLNRDDILFVNGTKRYFFHDQDLAETLNCYCQTEEVLLAYNIMDSCWEDCVTNFFSVLARSSKLHKTHVKVVNLFIPIDCLHWLIQRELTRSPELVDELFRDNDVRLIDLRNEAAMAAMNKHTPLTNSLVDYARKQWFKASKTGNGTKYEALVTSLRTQWLNIKWYQMEEEVRSRMNGWNGINCLTGHVDSDWLTKTITEMPEIRPVFVIAKDDSWDWRRSVEKSKKDKKRKMTQARLNMTKAKCLVKHS